MATYEIPLNPYPENFSITMANVQYTGTTRWNAQMEVWVVSLSDPEGVPILMNVPLIPGVNLLDQYPTLGISGALYAVVDHNSNAPPSYDNLGTTGHLYYVN